MPVLPPEKPPGSTSGFTHEEMKRPSLQFRVSPTRNDRSAAAPAFSILADDLPYNAAVTFDFSCGPLHQLYSQVLLSADRNSGFTSWESVSGTCGSTISRTCCSSVFLSTSSVPSPKFYQYKVPTLRCPALEVREGAFLA